jgi:serine/threonine protein kinase
VFTCEYAFKVKIHEAKSHILTRADFGISKRFAADEKSQTDSVIGMSEKYCSLEVYNGEPRGRAADIFSLGCVFIEMMTILCGIHLDKFADYRSRNANGNESFHGNLTEVQEWIERLRLISPMEFSWRLNISVKIDIISDMLSIIPDQRPLASDILTQLGGPRACCTSERESYEAEPNE